MLITVDGSGHRTIHLYPLGGLVLITGTAIQLEVINRPHEEGGVGGWPGSQYGWKQPTWIPPTSREFDDTVRIELADASELRQSVSVVDDTPMSLPRVQSIVDLLRAHTIEALTSLPAPALRAQLVEVRSVTTLARVGVRGLRRYTTTRGADDLLLVPGLQLGADMVRLDVEEEELLMLLDL